MNQETLQIHQIWQLINQDVSQETSELWHMNDNKYSEARITMYESSVYTDCIRIKCDYRRMHMAAWLCN